MQYAICALQVANRIRVVSAPGCAAMLFSNYASGGGENLPGSTPWQKSAIRSGSSCRCACKAGRVSEAFDEMRGLLRYIHAGRLKSCVPWPSSASCSWSLNFVSTVLICSVKRASNHSVKRPLVGPSQPGSQRSCLSMKELSLQHLQVSNVYTVYTYSTSVHGCRQTEQHHHSSGIPGESKADHNPNPKGKVQSAQVRRLLSVPNV